MGNLTKSLRVHSGDPCRPMDGVSFAGCFKLPTPPAGGNLPAAVQCPEGLASSHVERPQDSEIPGQFAPQAATLKAQNEAIPAKKKARREAPVHHVAPPLVACSSTL